MPSSSSISPLPLLLALALGLAGCSDGDGGSPTASPTAPPTVTALAVSPGSQIDPVGATRQFTATATYDDGSSGDVTSSVTWSSSAPGVATVNAAGLATASGAGALTVSASHGDSGVSASVAYGVEHDSEGTAGSPVGMTLGNPHTGTVGTGTSYYGISGLEAGSYTVLLGQLNDDADLAVYENPGWANPDCTSASGRIADEDCRFPEFVSSQLFIAVSGAATALGTTFELSVEEQQSSESSACSPEATVKEGEVGNPVPIPHPVRSGRFYETSNAIPTGSSNYYAVPAINARSHRVALSDLGELAEVHLYVYGDAGFSALLGSHTTGGTLSTRAMDVAPTGNTLYVRAEETTMEIPSCFTLSALPAEGSVAEPGAILKNKLTRLVVDTTASYYRMAVSPGTSYPVSMSSTATPSVKATVYDSNGFGGTSLCTFAVSTLDCVEEDDLGQRATAGGDALYIMLDGSGSAIGGLLELCIGDCPSRGK